MKRSIKAVSVAIAVAPLLSPMTSRAQQQNITINVPVNYENFDPSWKMKLSIECDVWFKTATNSDGRGFGQSFVEFTGGKYAGTVPVAVTVNPGPRPNWYTCTSNFIVGGQYCTPHPSVTYAPCKTSCTFGLGSACTLNAGGIIP
jgi:hypothetical protein